MPHFSRRLLLFAAPLLLAGCAQGGASRIAQSDVALLATDALLVALLGPAENRKPVSDTGEPPLLVKGAKETVVLATDYAAFVREGRGAFTESDIKTLEAEVVKITGKILEKEGFTLQTAPLGATVPDTAAAKTLRAMFTPATETGGSPIDRRTGRNRSLLLIRLTITDPATQEVLRIREFYSGRDVGVRP